MIVVSNDSSRYSDESRTTSALALQNLRALAQVIDQPFPELERNEAYVVACDRSLDDRIKTDILSYGLDLDIK